MDAHDPVTNASFIALALGLVKIIEVLVGLIAKKVKGEEHSHANGVSKPAEKLVVELSPEATEMIRDTHRVASNVERIVTLLDGDGTPMVYGPRHEVKELSRKVEDVVDDVKQIAAVASNIKS